MLNFNLVLEKYPQLFLFFGADYILSNATLRYTDHKLIPN